MTSNENRCVLIVNEFPKHDLIKDTKVIIKRKIDDWNLKIFKKTDEFYNYNLYPESKKSPLYFFMSADMPLKVLIPIREFLLLYRESPVMSLQDIAIRKFYKEINESNCIIFKDITHKHFDGVGDMLDCINRKLLDEIRSKACGLHIKGNNKLSEYFESILKALKMLFIKMKRVKRWI